MPTGIASEFDAIELTTSRRGSFVPSAYESDQRISFRRNSLASVKEAPIAENAMYSSEASPESFPDGGKEAYLVLLGSFLGLVADFGIPNSLGAIEAYVSTHQLQDLKSSTVSWIFSLHLGVMYFGGVIFGGLFDKYGARKLLVVGTALIFAGLMCTAESTQLYQFILSFSVLTATGTSLAMAPLIGVISHWFLKKRAMAASTATVGGLIGSSAFTSMLQGLYTKVGYKWAIRILAFVCLFFLAASIVLVKERRLEDKRIEPQETTNDNLSNILSTDELAPNEYPGQMFQEDSAPRKAERLFNFAPLRDMRFVTLTIAVYLAELNAMTLLTYLASYALSSGVQPSKAYLLLTLINLFGIPSRLATGFLADRYGRFNVMIVTSFFSMVFIWGLLLPSNGRLEYLYAFTILFGISSSAVLSLIAACLGQICPAAEFGKHYGVLYFCLAFLTVLGMYLSSLVINTGSKHDYQMWIVFEGCLATVCVIAWVSARWYNVAFRLCKF